MITHLILWPIRYTMEKMLQLSFYAPGFFEALEQKPTCCLLACTHPCDDSWRSTRNQQQEEEQGVEGLHGEGLSSGALRRAKQGRWWTGPRVHPWTERRAKWPRNCWGLARVFINPPSIQKWLTQSSKKENKVNFDTAMTLRHSQPETKNSKTLKLARDYFRKISYRTTSLFLPGLPGNTFCGSKARVLKYLFKATHRDVCGESSWKDADLCSQFSPEDRVAVKWLFTFDCKIDNSCLQIRDFF